MSSQNLRLAVQKEGRLSQMTLDFLKQSGFDFSLSGRSLVTNAYNFPLEILFLRSKDIPEIVADGVADLGICGLDMVREKDLEVVVQEKLGFGKSWLALAAPDLIDLEGKKVATSYTNVLQKYLDKREINAEIIPLSGSVEIAPTLSIADAICDLVSTGSTLRANGLQVLEMIAQFEAVLISQQTIRTQELFEKFMVRVRGRLERDKYKYIILNIKEKNLSKLVRTLPGLKSPTVTKLYDPDWVSASIVVEEDYFWDNMARIQAAGAQDILINPIEKIIR